MTLLRRRPHPLAVIALAGGLLVAGCGGDPDDGGDAASGSSTSDHNDADVAFASDMIQHHAQALAMVDLTNGRVLTPETEALVEAIRAAQAPEVETMTDWLVEWDEPIPATVNDHVNADGHGDQDDEQHGDDTGTDMPGMMSHDEMAELEAASDGDFEELFLTMMIEHHEGAVEMAEAEQADGRYGPAVDLAERIATSQLAEIDTMRRLLEK